MFYERGAGARTCCKYMTIICFINCCIFCRCGIKRKYHLSSRRINEYYYYYHFHQIRVVLFINSSRTVVFPILILVWIRVRVRVSISCISAIKTLSSSCQRQCTVVRNGIDRFQWHWVFTKEKIASALVILRTFQRNFRRYRKNIASRLVASLLITPQPVSIFLNIESTVSYLWGNTMFSSWGLQPTRTKMDTLSVACKYPFQTAMKQFGTEALKT